MLRLLLVVFFALAVSAQDQDCLFGCVQDFVDDVTDAQGGQPEDTLDNICKAFNDYSDCLESCDGWCDIFADAEAEFATLGSFQNTYCGQQTGLPDSCTEAFCDAFTDCDGSGGSGGDGETSRLIFYEGILCYYGTQSACGIPALVSSLTAAAGAPITVANTACDLFNNYCEDNGGAIPNKRGENAILKSVRYISEGFEDEAAASRSFNALSNAVGDGLDLGNNNVATDVDRTECTDCENECGGCALNGEWSYEVEQDCEEFAGCDNALFGDIEVKTYIVYSGTDERGQDQDLTITQKWDFGSLLGECESVQTGQYRFYSDSNRCNRVIVELEDDCDSTCGNAITEEFEDVVCNPNNLYLEVDTEAIRFEDNCANARIDGIDWTATEVPGEGGEDSDSGSMLAPSFVLLVLLAVAPFLQ